MMKGTSFFLVLVLECLIGLHRSDQLHLLQHQWLGRRLGLLGCWMVCLGNELRACCHFWDGTQVLHFGLLHCFWGILAHSSRWNGHLNSPIPIHFSSLIPKMSCHLLFDHFQFTLIHGPNIPGSYAILFLQHRTLLPSLVTSTTWCCFRFGSVSLIFLELFLHSSPVACWAPTNLGSSSFSIISFWLFILFMGKCQ